MHLDLPQSPADATETSSNREVLIRVEGVSKKFCRSLKKSLWYGVQDIFSEFKLGKSAGASAAEHALRNGEFWAVQDVSFELRRGECLGLIGRNGAGKTTLLKMLNGLIKPDAGRIEMRGRVSALIALGAGFNPILTGRENIYINASILGLSKRETDAKIEEIIDFANIRDFINTPVQSYSSGMQVRLGFAIATALEPEILLIDEVLAVGDAEFRSKCYHRIDSLRQQCATILVSHNMEHIGRVCSLAMNMDRGVKTSFGDVGMVIEDYQQRNDSAVDSFIKCYPPISSMSLSAPDTVNYKERLHMSLSVECSQPAQILPRLILFDAHQQVSGEGNYRFNDLRPITLPAGKSRIELALGPLHLRGGQYLLHCNLHDTNGKLLVGGYNCHTFNVVAPSFGETSYQLETSLVIKS